VTTGPLRILCVDVGDASAAVSASAVTRAVAMASSWDRLLCFGRAATVAGMLTKQERAEREGVWLDVAASWLLATDSVVDPPSRPRPGPLESNAMAIGTPGLEAGGLAVSERLVELAGTWLVMAVPGKSAIDAVDNAHVWLVGGAPFAVDTEPGKANGRAVIAVGGSITGVVVDGGEVRITSWDLGGTVVHQSTAAIGGSNRLSVRSASA